MDGARPPAPGLAVLGGSFDPPHLSHTRLLLEARQRLPVDRVLVIPAGDHPHKQDLGMTPAPHRLAMCRLAFGDLPDIVVDDREVRRSGLSFTADTLAELATEHPAHRLFFLIGSDNLPLLPSWHQHHRMLAACTVVTYPRRGYPVTAATLRGLDLTTAERQDLLEHVLELPADAVAATTIRDHFRHGNGAHPELLPAVAAYIDEHDLYRP